MYLLSFYTLLDFKEPTTLGNTSERDPNLNGLNRSIFMSYGPI